jgi:hypothetical protein
MFITKKHLNRRTFLRGASGAMIALPLLDAMVPALTAQTKTVAKPQFRFGAVYWPAGTSTGPSAPEMWRPKVIGTDFEFTVPTKPFEPFRDQVTLVGGLDANRPSGSHMLASCMWLNSTPPYSHDTANFREDTTLDQRIAAKIGQDTPLPSLELAVEGEVMNAGGAGSCGTEGYSCIYWSTIAWRTPTSPLPTENNPRVLFERLFGSASTTAERLQRLEEHRSILDSFRQRAASMKAVLGTRDRARLDDYLDNIREVERRVQNASARAEQQSGESSYMPDAPAGMPDSYDEHVKIMFDLQTLAFQGDFTRVFTFMMNHEGSEMAYPGAGVLDGDHTVSHHANQPINIERRLKINRYHSELMAYFLDKLKKTPDGDGNLLDHTVMLYGSGMGNGNIHDHTNLPLAVLGGKAFGVKGGRHLDHPSGTPYANLLVTLGEKAGLDIEKMDNSNGKVDL